MLTSDYSTHNTITVKAMREALREVADKYELMQAPETEKVAKEVAVVFVNKLSGLGVSGIERINKLATYDRKGVAELRKICDIPVQDAVIAESMHFIRDLRMLLHADTIELLRKQ
jgi:hypothetical protein